MSGYETQVCERHGEAVALVSRETAESLGVPYGCQACRAETRNRPDPATMTRQERRDELEALLTEPDLQGFDIVWERTDLLVGRSTFIHELAYPEYLYHEIMTGVIPSVEGVVAKFPPEMSVLMVATRCVSHGGSLFSGDSGVCEAVEGGLAPWMDEEFLAECEAETVWVMPATPVTVKSRVSHNSDYATTPQEGESEPE